MDAHAHMTQRMRCWVGSFNLLLGVGALIVLALLYGLAEHLVQLGDAADPGERVTITLPLAWWHVDCTLGMAVLLLGAAAGAVGSAVQQSIVFARRAGFGTLQAGYVWWYLLRPVWSALLGAVAVMGLNAGLISIGDQTTSDAGVTVLAVTGAVAGLFTDQVLQQLSHRLGATPPGALAPEPAQGQQPPQQPEPQPDPQPVGARSNGSADRDVLVLTKPVGAQDSL